ALEAPGAVELVARLVILLQLPLLDLLPAPPGRAPDEVGPVVEEQRRHTDLRERELVGAVIVAPIRELVRPDHAPLVPRDRFGGLVERGLAHADQRHPPGAAEDI